MKEQNRVLKERADRRAQNRRQAQEDIKAVGQTVRVIRREERARRRSTEAVKMNRIEFGKYGVSLARVRLGINEAIAGTWRLNGAFGFFARVALKAVRGGLDKLAGNTDKVNDEDPPRLGLVAQIVGGAIAVAFVAAVGTIAAMAAGIAGLIRQVERLDTVARTNPILSFGEQQRIANAEQLGRFGPGELGRDLRYLSASAARNDPRRNAAFRQIGIDPQRLAAGGLSEGVRALETIRSATRRDAAGTNVALQTISGGEQFRASSIQSSANRVDLIRQGFNLQPLAQSREQLEAIPRALNKITLSFQRLFVVSWAWAKWRPTTLLAMDR